MSGVTCSRDSDRGCKSCNAILAPPVVMCVALASSRVASRCMRHFNESSFPLFFLPLSEPRERGCPPSCSHQANQLNSTQLTLPPHVITQLLPYVSNQSKNTTRGTYGACPCIFHVPASVSSRAGGNERRAEQEARGFLLMMERLMIVETRRTNASNTRVLVQYL